MKLPKEINCCLYCLVLALILPVGLVRADEAGDGKEYRIEGILYFGSRDCADSQPGPCDAYFELEGGAARQLYEKMRAAERADICTGGWMKTDSTGLHCNLSGSGDYACNFGYDLVRYRIVEGDVSC